MFLILPTGVDYRTRRYPIVTFTIIGICTLLWLLQLSLRLANGSGVDDWFFENLWYTPALSHWWTHLTWMFVHAGFFHLAGNMLYLFLFGSCVEDSIGRPRFIALYLLTGLGAELAHVAATAGHFSSTIPLGGASGAISGCIGAFLVLLTRSRIEFKYILIFFFRFFSGEFFLPAWLVISFWFLKDLLEMVLADPGAGIAFGAHVGGTLSGIVLMLVQKAFPTRFPEGFDDHEEPVVPVVIARPDPVIRAPRAEPRRFVLPSQQQPTETPKIYLHVSGAQSGPFTAAQIEKMFGEGEIPAGAFYWQEGMEKWESAEDLRSVGS